MYEAGWSFVWALWPPNTDQHRFAWVQLRFTTAAPLTNTLCTTCEPRSYCEPKSLVSGVSMVVCQIYGCCFLFCRKISGGRNTRAQWFGTCLRVEQDERCAFRLVCSELRVLLVRFLPSDHSEKKNCPGNHWTDEIFHLFQGKWKKNWFWRTWKTSRTSLFTSHTHTFPFSDLSLFKDVSNAFRHLVEG